MMIGVDFSSLARVGEKPERPIITSLWVNWLIKPFTMAALGVLFFKVLCLPASSRGRMPRAILRLILPRRGPRARRWCLSWSQLTKGDPNYNRWPQVSVKRAIMLFGLCAAVPSLLGVNRHCRAVGDADPVGCGLRGQFPLMRAW